jgi:hypothetical protein
MKRSKQISGVTINRNQDSPPEKEKRDAEAGEVGWFSEATQCRVGPTERHYKDVVAGRSEAMEGEA